MILFRRTPNIRDKVVQANHSGRKSYQPILLPEGKSYIADLSNHSKTVANTISNRICYKEGGKANTVGAIYFPLFTKHKKLNVRQTQQSLNGGFHSNHSDAVYHPDRSN